MEEQQSSLNYEIIKAVVAGEMGNGKGHCTLRSCIEKLVTVKESVSRTGV